MQPSDKRDFAIEIMKLTIAFSKNFDDKRAEAICNVFAEALSEFAIDEIQAATREQIRESRFFPSPHDLAVICRRHRRAAREAHEAREHRIQRGCDDDTQEASGTGRTSQT